MQDLTIRRADRSDAEGLAQCLEAAYAEYAARLVDLPSMSENCADEIERHEVWVAEAGGPIVGGLMLAPSDGYMLLVNVAVHPDHRGTGLGQRFLVLAEIEARRHGYDELRLNTHAGMTDTVRLYARNGWSEDGRQGNTVRMKKPVPG